MFHRLISSSLLILSIHSSSSSSLSSTTSSYPSTTTGTYSKRINFSPKRAQAGSIDHTILFRNALFTLSTSSSVLTQPNPHKFIIIDPKTPFKFGSSEFYWDSTYLDPSDDLPVICSNPIEPSDPKLGKVFFVNGSRPREIAWACPHSHGCCGYECCKETSLGESMIRLVLLLIGLAIVCFFLLELLRWCVGCCSRYKQVPSNIAHKHSSRHSAPAAADI